MIKHASRAVARAFSGGLYRLSDSEMTADPCEPAPPPHLTKQASLYVHWPYCLRRCSYCNFNKYIPKQKNDDVMTECLQRETQTLLQLSQVSCITSVFFGGGTPSLAHPSTIAAILETVSKQVSLSDQAEVTLEVNPTPVGMSKLEDYRHAGVNRFSIGVQSLQDEDLKSLGRDHSSHEALQTVEEARRLCPGRVSVDVMFGRPKQTVESWERELLELLRVCDDHVSLYQLTLERGTQLFKQVESGEVTMPTEEATAEMYHSVRKVLHQHGFRQYEVSNFARHHWGLFSPQMSLHDVFGASVCVQELLQSGQLILDNRGMRCSWDGLALLDSILPVLLMELERNISKKHHIDHMLCTDGQTKKTPSLLYR